MQNDTLLALLLLDPFMTVAEAEKEFAALSAAARRPKPDSPTPGAASRRTAACGRPARTTRDVPVLHHPPVDAG